MIYMHIVLRKKRENRERERERERERDGRIETETDRQTERRRYGLRRVASSVHDHVTHSQLTPGIGRALIESKRLGIHVTPKTIELQSSPAPHTLHNAPCLIQSGCLSVGEPRRFDTCENLPSSNQLRVLLSLGIFLSMSKLGPMS